MSFLAFEPECESPLFSAHLLIVRSSARSSNAVGALFGLAQSAFSLGEGVAPALVS